MLGLSNKILSQILFLKMMIKNHCLFKYILPSINIHFGKEETINYKSVKIAHLNMEINLIINFTFVYNTCLVM